MSWFIHLNYTEEATVQNIDNRWIWATNQSNYKHIISEIEGIDCFSTVQRSLTAHLFNLKKLLFVVCMGMYLNNY